MNNQLRDRYLTDPFIAQALDAYASGSVSYTEALETAVVALAEARERLESQYRELLMLTRAKQVPQTASPAAVLTERLTADYPRTTARCLTCGAREGVDLESGQIVRLSVAGYCTQCQGGRAK